MARPLPKLDYAVPAAPDGAVWVIGSRLYIVREAHAPGWSAPDWEFDLPVTIRLALVTFETRVTDADPVLGRYRSTQDAKAALGWLAAGLCSVFDDAWLAEPEPTEPQYKPRLGPDGRALPRSLPPVVVETFATPLDGTDEDLDAMLADWDAPAPEPKPAPAPKLAPRRGRKSRA